MKPMKSDTTLGGFERVKMMSLVGARSGFLASTRSHVQNADREAFLLLLID